MEIPLDINAVVARMDEFQTEAALAVVTVGSHISGVQQSRKIEPVRPYVSPWFVLASPPVKGDIFEIVFDRYEPMMRAVTFLVIAVPETSVGAIS
jgi:hypothetical protein